MKKEVAAVLIAFLTFPAFGQTQNEVGETCEELDGVRTTIVMRLSDGPIVFLGGQGELVLADCKSRSAVEISLVDENSREDWQSKVTDQILKADVAKGKVSFADFEKSMRDQGFNTRNLVLGSGRCVCSDPLDE